MAEEGTENRGTPALSVDDIKGKTPEQLESIVRLCDAHIRALHQNDRGELRDLDDAEEDAFRTLIEVRDRAVTKLDEHRRVQEVLNKRPKSVESALHAMGHRDDDPYHEVRRMSFGEARDKALRTLEKEGAGLRSDQQDQVERTIRKNTDIARRILVTETEAYRTAWMKLVSRPNGAMLLDEDERKAMLAYEEYRAMSEGTNTAGGYGIPVKLAA